MQNRYRYTVTLMHPHIGHTGTFPHFHTYDAALAIQVACMLQSARGEPPNVNYWKGIRHPTMRSAEADGIQVTKQMMEGDMAELLSDYEREQDRRMSAELDAEAEARRHG